MRPNRLNDKIRFKTDFYDETNTSWETNIGCWVCLDSGYNRGLCVRLDVAEGRKYFRDFLRTEFSEENVLFWLACEELKRETNAELIEEKARSIYEDYISILSPKEVRFSVTLLL